MERPLRCSNCHKAFRPICTTCGIGIVADGDDLVCGCGAGVMVTPRVSTPLDKRLNPGAVDMPDTGPPKLRHFDDGWRTPPEGTPRRDFIMTGTEVHAGKAHIALDEDPVLSSAPTRNMRAKTEQGAGTPGSVVYAKDIPSGPVSRKRETLRTLYLDKEEKAAIDRMKEYIVRHPEYAGRDRDVLLVHLAERLLRVENFFVDAGFQLGPSKDRSKT